MEEEEEEEEVEVVVVVVVVVEWLAPALLSAVMRAPLTPSPATTAITTPRRTASSRRLPLARATPAAAPAAPTRTLTHTHTLSGARSPPRGTAPR